MFSMTIFKPPRWWAEQERYVYDNKTHRRMDFQDFDGLEKTLFGLSQQQKKGKKDAELISPAIFESGTTRANKNVIAWAGWCAVDVDDIEIDGGIDAWVRNLVPSWRFICYSTASNRRGRPKFRLVFELGGTLEAERIAHFWYALNKELGDIGDSQTKDLSRMYYIPSKYDDADNFIFTGTGSPIDIDDLLSRHPYVEKKRSGSFLDRLPPEMVEQVINHRKTKLQNTNYSWSSYLDCPFVNKSMINEYRRIAYVDNSGRYAMIYKIMCSIASNAIKREYPIQTAEIVDLIKQLDADTSRRYENRPLTVEADRAVEYAYRNLQ